MKKSITTSLFEMFKIGPGPSCSHTIGPMKAAAAFRERLSRTPADELAQVESIDVFLYGSLSASGLGHGTHKPIIGGLLGWTPEACDTGLLLDLLERDDDQYDIAIGRRNIPFRAVNIHLGRTEEPLPCRNTLRFTATGNDGPIVNAEYYSIDGGFIRERGEAEKQLGPLPHPYRSIPELQRLAADRELPLHEILLQNEESISNDSRREITASLDRILETMQQAVKNGLSTRGALPGPIGLQRKGRVLYQRSQKGANHEDSFLAALNSYALAASEENAAGRKVVTAPTSGSAGIIPAIVSLLVNHFDRPVQSLKEGLVTAAAIGLTARHNASIAGAEVGCQGEIGVAATMAAACLTQTNGGSQVLVNAVPLETWQCVNPEACFLAILAGKRRDTLRAET